MTRKASILTTSTTFFKIIFVMLMVLGSLLIDHEFAEAVQSIEGKLIKLTDNSVTDSCIRLGDEVDCEYEICGMATECFVRVKTSASCGTCEEVIELTIPQEGKWQIGKDGWWYCTEPISKANPITFSSAFVLTGNESFVTRSFGRNDVRIIKVAKAEAVEADALDPDWTSDEPWALPPDDAGGDDTANDGNSRDEVILNGSLMSDGSGQSKTEGYNKPARATSNFGSLAQTGDNALLISICFVLVGAMIAFTCISITKGTR